jgi:hypothetical protein
MSCGLLDCFQFKEVICCAPFGASKLITLSFCVSFVALGLPCARAGVRAPRSGCGERAGAVHLAPSQRLPSALAPADRRAACLMQAAALACTIGVQ